MNFSKNTIVIAAGVVLAILLFFAGCSIGKRSCPSATIKEVVKYILKTDTLSITVPGKTTYKNGKEVVIIKSDEQKDSLLVAQQRKIDNTEKLLDYYRTQYEALAEAGVGDIITGEPPQVQKSGESLSKDSMVVVRWRVTVEGDMPDGTEAEPNPYFEVESFQKQSIQTVDATKPYALGAGIGTALGIDGKGLDVIPSLHFRKNKTVWFGRYHLNTKAVEVGLSKEVQFGKQKGE